MINMTNCSDVNMWFATFELGHCSDAEKVGPSSFSHWFIIN